MNIRHHALLTVLLLLGWNVDAGALTCTITMGDVTFGNVDPLAGAVTDTSTNVTVTCSDLVFPLIDPTVGVCIYLDAGSGGSDGTVYRHMLNGADVLNYNLYKDAARTQIWGSETAFPASGAQRIVITLTGLLPSTGTAVVPVYGRIPAGISDRPIGSYSSNFAGGARARYSLVDTLACDGVAGTQATDTFVASATIMETCTVESDDINFGSRTQLNSATDAAGQVRTSCSTGLTYSVALGPGGGGSFGARRMVHPSFPAEIVNYQLYTDVARSLIWGDGTGGTVTSGATGSGSPQAANVYGRVPLQATPRPGAYQDTVVVTVTY